MCSIQAHVHENGRYYDQNSRNHKMSHTLFLLKQKSKWDEIPFTHNRRILPNFPSFVTNFTCGIPHLSNPFADSTLSSHPKSGQHFCAVFGWTYILKHLD